MLGLPKTTEFNKRIPKQKFYENLDISPTVKKAFVEQIKVIYWRNKIAASTTNLAEGKDVSELEVFEVKLHKPEIDMAVLKQIDREIPYHIMYILEYEGKHQVWIGYKEAAQSGNKAFKVNSYYNTDWFEEEPPLKLEGLDIDAVYEGFVRQIAGETLGAVANTKSLKESVAKAEQKATLQKQIETLQTKLRREKQLNKQMQINAEIKKLRKELEAIYERIVE